MIPPVQLPVGHPPVWPGSAVVLELLQQLVPESLPMLVPELALVTVCGAQPLPGVLRSRLLGQGLLLWAGWGLVVA